MAKKECGKEKNAGNVTARQYEYDNGEIGVLYKYWEDMKLLISYRSTILTTMKIIIINIFINVPRYFPYNFSVLLLIFKSFS